jgi:hypothetical protein
MIVRIDPHTNPKRKRERRLNGPAGYFERAFARTSHLLRVGSGRSRMAQLRVYDLEDERGRSEFGGIVAKVLALPSGAGSWTRGV